MIKDKDGNVTHYEITPRSERYNIVNQRGEQYSKMANCHVCGWRVAKYAKRCPSCGQSDPGGDGSIRGTRVFVVIVGFVIFAYIISKYLGG